MSLREKIYAVRRLQRVIDRVRGFGISIETKREIDRMFGEVWRGSELIDAKVTYKFVSVVKGNTFPAREILKAEGYRWDGGRKEWRRNGVPGGLWERLVSLTVQR